MYEICVFCVASVRTSKRPLGVLECTKAASVVTRRRHYWLVFLLGNSYWYVYSKYIWYVYSKYIHTYRFPFSVAVVPFILWSVQISIFPWLVGLWLAVFLGKYCCRYSYMSISFLWQLCPSFFGLCRVPAFNGGWAFRLLSTCEKHRRGFTLRQPTCKNAFQGETEACYDDDTGVARFVQKKL